MNKVLLTPWQLTPSKYDTGILEYIRIGYDENDHYWRCWAGIIVGKYKSRIEYLRTNITNDAYRTHNIKTYTDIELDNISLQEAQNYLDKILIDSGYFTLLTQERYEKLLVLK